MAQVFGGYSHIANDAKLFGKLRAGSFDRLGYFARRSRFLAGLTPDSE